MIMDVVILQKVFLVQNSERPAGKYLIASVIHLLHLVSLAEKMGYDWIDFGGCRILPYVNIEVWDGFRVHGGPCFD